MASRHICAAYCWWWLITFLGSCSHCAQAAAQADAKKKTVDANSFYAAKAGCTEILTDESSEFFRIWLYCIAYGLAAACFITVPLYWCVPRGKHDRVFDEDFCSGAPSPEQAQESSHSDPESDVSVPVAKQVSKKGTGGLLQRAATSGKLNAPGQTSEEPDLTAARKHLKHSSNTHRDGSWRGFWSTSVDDLGSIGGIGIEMYFRLLQGLGLCFFYMGICTSPLVAFSWNGNFVPDTGQALAKATIGNLGMIAPEGTSQEDRLIILGCQGESVKRYTAIFSYLDALAIVFFIYFIVNFRFRRIPAEIRSNDRELVSIVDYSIMIDGLPAQSDKPYEDDLREHIKGRIEAARAQHGDDGDLPDVKINELCLVRDYDKRLGCIKERAELNVDKEIAEYKVKNGVDSEAKKVEKLQAKIDKLSKKLSEQPPSEDDLPVVRAYAVLNSTADVQKMLVHYRFGNVWLFRMCQGRDNRFRGHALRVREAPEPTNIIPENQDVHPPERYSRQAILFLLWVLAVLLSAALIYMTGRESTDNAVSGSRLGSATCDKGTETDSDVYICKQQVVTLWNNSYAASLSSDAKACFCQTKGYADVLAKSELSHNVCKSWLQNIGKTYGRTIAASLITVIINATFKFLFFWFAAAERPLSISVLNKSVMYKTFASQFINTALVVHLINYHGKYGIFNGDYEDFERGWYAIVGGAMMSTLLFNSFVGAAVYIATDIWNRFYRCCCARRQKHQAELISLYTNPQFDIAARYAQLLTTVFCTLVYSPGLPLVNYLGSLYCFVNYLTDKWLLLYSSSRPPLYDCSMPKTASRVLILAAPLHFIAGIGMFSHACTFPSSAVGGRLGTLTNSANLEQIETVDGTGGWHKRMTRSTTWMLFLFLLVSLLVIALWILSLILGATFGKAMKCCLMICCPQKAVNPNGEDKADGMTWKEAQPKIDARCPPASYRLEKHPEFKDLVKYLQPGADDSLGVNTMAVIPKGPEEA